LGVGVGAGAGVEAGAESGFPTFPCRTDGVVGDPLPHAVTVSATIDAMTAEVTGFMMSFFHGRPLGVAKLRCSATVLSHTGGKSGQNRSR
jgi:hypothetical protein